MITATRSRIMPSPIGVERAASVAPQGPMVPRPYRVAGRRRETRDTWTLDLVPASGPPITVEPGQFMMVYAFGVGEVPVSVSDCSAGRLVHTVRAVGAVTEALCASRPGTVVGVRGPFGRGWPMADAAGADVVVVAGGLGLAPLRPLVREVLARRDDFGAVTVLVGSRTPADVLYRREVAGWRDRRDVQAEVTVDAAGAGWAGRVGLVTALLPAVRFDPAAAVAFVCGPEVMMRFVARALVDAGVPARRVQLSLERSMRCGVGHCGHCQLGPTLICRDGPVYSYAEVGPLLAVREL
jgi:NAD(P)H-flavin reductase